MSSGRGRARAIARPAAWIVASALAVTAVVAAGVPVSTVAAVTPTRSGHPTCPWSDATYDAQHTPAELAAIVVPHMSLSEKLGMLDLAAARGYENSTTAIPSLCIPALTLQDGPDGLAYGDTGVTQLPSSLALAATFDTGLALRYGQVEGNEARRQGVDVVQGPNLNIDRVPQSGRAFEGYGEDPFLVSEMGVADISGIQSEGVMSDAKHFTAYNQETDRIRLNEEIANRALEEIYLPPFQAAVTRANVASIMCAYGSIDDVSDCANPKLYHLLGKWGFHGFVRSDLAAVADAPGAFNAGMDAIKPAETASLLEAISDGTLPMARIDGAVERILGEMFAYGMIQRPIVGKVRTKVTNSAHGQVALEVAERSMVLLKNRDGLLPLSAHGGGSIAVIGADAGNGAMTAGFGSAHVVAPFRSLPVDAIRAVVGRRTRVVYVPGGSSAGAAPTIPLASWKIAKASKFAPRIVKGIRPQVLRGMVGTGSLQSVGALLRHATVTISVPKSGPYVFSLDSNGDAWLSVDGNATIASVGQHSRSTWTAEAALRGHKRYTVALAWYPLRSGMPVVGVRPAGPSIASAVAAARHAKVAIVFANDVTMEGTDRPSLDLPSDENALISAVAAVNRHTVVVLNTGGAVYMPWIAKVSAVLEGWYPGEQDGRATTAVLFGRVDPAGRLPVTFPKSANEVPTHARANFPGTAGTVYYDEGLDVGYRYDDTKGITPLFPFGYGLSYTSFSLSDLTTTSSSDGVDAAVTVTNTGLRSGTEVVQAYLQFPSAAGEPPVQLKAFGTVTLAPGASQVVPLKIAPSAFEAYLTGGWQTVAGSYEILVGTSSDSLPLSASITAPVVVTVAAPKAAPTA